MADISRRSFISLSAATVAYLALPKLPGLAPEIAPEEPIEALLGHYLDFKRERGPTSSPDEIRVSPSLFWAYDDALMSHERFSITACDEPNLMFKGCAIVPDDSVDGLRARFVAGPPVPYTWVEPVA